MSFTAYGDWWWKITLPQCLFRVTSTHFDFDRVLREFLGADACLIMSHLGLGLESDLMRSASEKLETWLPIYR